MRYSGALFSSVTKASASFPPKVLEKKFDRRYALCAAMGCMVATDESSCFEWVGSFSAVGCTILVLHGLNACGTKVAVCGHLSPTQSPESIPQMVEAIQLQSVLSAHLVGACMQPDDVEVKQLIKKLATYGVPSRFLSLGCGLSEISLNVRTGQTEYHSDLSAANTGEKDMADAMRFENRQYQIFESEGVGSLLHFALDGRDSNDVRRVQRSIEQDEMVRSQFNSR